ncbi:MAG TPA: ATP-binding protein [Polyangiaceae bacterium]|nr:ATP-binding protein [Polyangiaceae bacterium]
MTPQDRYIEVTARLNKLNTAGAGAISLLTLIEKWGTWRHVMVIAAVQVLVIPWNVLVSLVLLKRVGLVRGEVLRTVVNLGSGVALAYYLDWPVACWLWLPYVAVAFDHVDDRLAAGITAAFCVVMDSVALFDGVAVRYPMAFTMLAFFCSLISKVRFDALRAMLVRSDDQMREIASAHSELSIASERLHSEMKARQHAEVELRHAQKLEAVGRLAAGIAHEINTPVQFVGDNLRFLREANDDLLLLIEHYRSALERISGDPAKADIIADVNQAEDTADLSYLIDHLPSALGATQEGLARIATIVRSMKEFAHPNQKEMVPMDLNQGILTTLTIARSEYKHVAEVETNLADLPRITCFPGDVNQALLNIIVNAAHAIGDVVAGTANKGRITVRTELDNEFVQVAISDSGGGIPQDIQNLIFDPFFTTKEVGRGTGQGLAIARSIVVEKHGGTLTFETKMGEGTTFLLRLPVDGRHSQRMKAVKAA